nr:phosphodiester glycosidase family protein [Streptococcus sp. NLN76]
MTSVNATNTSSSATTSPTNVSTTDTSYTDDNIQISLETITTNDTTVYVADIHVSSADYLKTALAQNTYGTNITAKTSETASSNNAILAVNGDYYGANASGYVIRNGIIYRDTVRDNADFGDLAIYADGSFKIIKETEVTAQELVDDGVVNLLAFGPALIENGQIAVDTSTEVGRAMASNPRSAIGIIDENHYIIVVADGRTEESQGLSLYQMAEVLKEYDAQTAYNLDGGGSSTLYFNGQVINNPTTNGNTISEREVSDIVYIGY